MDCLGYMYALPSLKKYSGSQTLGFEKLHNEAQEVAI